MAPQGVDVVERVKMEEYLQQWCVSQYQGAPKILWGYKKVHMDTKSCQWFKGNLATKPFYSSDSMLIILRVHDHVFNFQSVPTEVLA